MISLFGGWSFCCHALHLVVEMSMIDVNKKPSWRFLPLNTSEKSRLAGGLLHLGRGRGKVATRKT